MYIIVSTDQRIPEDLAHGFQVEQWTPNEFFTKASDDDGLEIDEGIWYDVADLTEEIYDGLAAYIEAGINIIYYRFYDRPAPNFPISQDIKVYGTPEPEPEPEPEEIAEPEPEKVNNTPQVNTTQVEQTQPIIQTQPVQQVPPVQPVQNTQNYQMQPNYNQQMTPYMNQQPMQGYSQVPYQPSYMPQRPVQPMQPMQPMKPMTPPSATEIQQISTEQLKSNMSNMLQYDDYDAGDKSKNRKAAPAKVILFGSSKGGTGKTFTCLISAYWYAKLHPTQKIALADFDIIDGQVGITINKITPTMQDYYKLYKNDRRDFTYLDNCKVKSDHFSPNIDFYLAPSQDIPTITNDNEFWNDIFQKLISNYDVVFFDSGIDYIGKLPISQLYKIADSIIITCNPSINSTKSVIKQFKTLSGQRQNNVFRPGDDILSKVKVVLTRMSNMTDINDIVCQNISTYAPIVAQFGQIDKEISQVQWYQMWTIIDSTPEITEQLNKIIEF